MSAKHIVARQVTGSTTSYVPLLDIPAASGELKSLGVSDGIEYHSFRVTIDGTTLADAYLSGTASGSVRSNTGLAIGLRFEQSLLVQVSGSVLSPQTTYWAVASTDSSEFTNRTTFTQSIEGAPYLFERLTYGREDGTEYDVTMPIGPDQISKIVLDEGVPIPGEQVTGYIQLRSGNGESLSEETVPLVLRINPSRRNHIIRRESGEAFTLDNVIGEKRFALPQDWLTATLREYFYRRDIPGPPYPAPYGPYVEIAADLPGYANYPASIVLW
jgi:hypothetical protein